MLDKTPTDSKKTKKAIEVGGRIRVLRDNKGLSDIELAVILGVTRNAVTQWETGRAMPKPQKLPAIAEALDTTVEWLLVGDDAAEMARAQTTAELEMLRTFRAVPDDQKAILIAAAVGLAAKRP